MSIKLKRNDDSFWTIDNVNHIKKYKAAYFSNKKCSDEQLNEFENRIKAGEKILINDSNRARFYEIYDTSDNRIGDITLTYKDNDEWELAISIFSIYSNNGYAENAINEVIKLIHNECSLIRAIILKENIRPEIIKNVLEKCGFQSMPDDSYVKVTAPD